MNTLAIDIGGSKLSLAAFVDRQMTRRTAWATERAGGPGWVVAQILKVAGQWRREIPLDRCGIGFGGPVDFASQRALLSHPVAGWSDFPLVAALQQGLGVSVIMDNDANAGALGEAHYGAGVGCDPLFYMTLSTGIGGGIVIDGHVLRGADSLAGEIGHLPVRPDGPICLCGRRGCLERLCSGLWLERDYGRPAEQLLEDPNFVPRYVGDLALGLKACSLLLNPARIVIGGGISKAGERLFGPLRAELRRQLPPWSQAHIDVQPAALADESVLWGALVLAEQSQK